MATVVKAGPNDSNDQLIRKFKKKVMADRILAEIRKRDYFKKPSELKKEKLKELKKKNK